MNISNFKERINNIAKKRELLVSLANQPQYSDLTIDINQALIELDDLLKECDGITVDS
jgi:hypothetical protein